MNYKKLIGGVLGLILAIWISTMTPPAPMNLNSMIFLGTFICAVTWMVVELMPDYVIILIACMSWVTLKVLPFTSVFSQFSADTIWLLIGALGMGVGVAQSGLLNRIALIIMSKFPPSFKGMTTALYVAGNIINPLIPSATAKVSIMTPFAKAIGEKLEFENESEGMTGLFAATWMSTGVLYPLFLSASFFNYTLIGLLPKAVGAKFTWMTWLSASWVWGLIVLILAYFAIQFLYKPKGKSDMDPGYVKEQLAKLGPLTRNEKIVSVILSASLLMWMTEQMHHIIAAQVAIFALMLMLAFNIFDRTAFRAKIAWDSIYFIGGILCLAAQFGPLNISTWLGAALGPYLTPLFGNMYLFIVVMCVFLFFLRFVLVSQTASLAIFVVIFVPLAVAAGVNPWIPAFVILVSVNLWNVIYQNTTFLAAYYAGNGMVKHKDTVKMSVAYAAINVVALLASVPLWKLMGLMP